MCSSVLFIIKRRLLKELKSKKKIFKGITIKPLVKFLNVKTASEKETSMNERITGRFMDHIISGMEGVLGEFGNLKIRDMYRQLDIKYIKPCLLRENKVSLNKNLF